MKEPAPRVFSKPPAKRIHIQPRSSPCRDATVPCAQDPIHADERQELILPYQPRDITPSGNNNTSTAWCSKSCLLFRPDGRTYEATRSYRMTIRVLAVVRMGNGWSRENAIGSSTAFQDLGMGNIGSRSPSLRKPMFTPSSSPVGCSCRKMKSSLIRARILTNFLQAMRPCI